MTNQEPNDVTVVPDAEPVPQATPPEMPDADPVPQATPPEANLPTDIVDLVPPVLIDETRVVVHKASGRHIKIGVTRVAEIEAGEVDTILFEGVETPLDEFRAP